MSERMRRPMPMRLKCPRRIFIFVSRVPSAKASLGAILEASFAGPIEERIRHSFEPCYKTDGRSEMLCFSIYRGP
jgi:hypothetical protein